MNVLERVGSSRMMLDGKFPYPEARACVDYAIGEMYEYRDAIMRQERPGDKRNNGREHDPRKEIGQAMYMIASALLRTERNIEELALSQGFFPETRDWYYYTAVQDLACGARNMIDNPKNYLGISNLEDAWDMCVKLCLVHGWDVLTLIEDTCADFERKHLQPYAPDARNGGQML